MYTAKLSLNRDNVEDVLAVAGFLQMQEIVSACNALKSLAVPAENPPESQPPPAAPGTEPPRVPSPGEAGNHPGEVATLSGRIQTHALGASVASMWGLIPS